MSEPKHGRDTRPRIEIPIGDPFEGPDGGLYQRMLAIEPPTSLVVDELVDEIERLRSGLQRLRREPFLCGNCHSMVSFVHHPPLIAAAEPEPAEVPNGDD